MDVLICIPEGDQLRFAMRHGMAGAYRLMHLERGEWMNAVLADYPMPWNALEFPKLDSDWL